MPVGIGIYWADCPGKKLEVNNVISFFIYAIIIKITIYFQLFLYEQ